MDGTTAGNGGTTGSTCDCNSTAVVIVAVSQAHSTTASPNRAADQASGAISTAQ